MILTFEVHDMPAPQGSKRHVGRGVMIESSKRVKPWREAVKHAALDATNGYDVAATLTGPVAVTIVFRLPRPKGHYRTGRNAHLLRDTAPLYPATKPDLDKLLRSTLDALTASGVIRDDSQVVWINSMKRYGAPGATIRVRPADLGGSDV